MRFRSRKPWLAGVEAIIEPLLPGFMNCSKHCWCAYDESDPLVKGMEAIVRGFKKNEHPHSPHPDAPYGCVSCGKVEFRHAT